MPQTSLGPTSGSELDYDADAWNSLENVQKLNCYDYAFANANPNQQRFSQPLDHRPDDDLYSCAMVEAGLKERHPGLQVVDFDTPCGPRKRKIALVVDPDGQSDYHFLRQDSDGYWSHKPGYKNPRRVDGAGNIIEAPHLADMNFDGFNYTNMCNYYCIPETPYAQ